MIFKDFDFNHDGYMDYYDFLLFVLPQDCKKVREKVEQRQEKYPFPGDR
jgi:hypothetical protein